MDLVLSGNGREGAPRRLELAVAPGGREVASGARNDSGYTDPFGS